MHVLNIICCFLNFKLNWVFFAYLVNLTTVHTAQVFKLHPEAGQCSLCTWWMWSISKEKGQDIALGWFAGGESSVLSPWPRRCCSAVPLSVLSCVGETGVRDTCPSACWESVSAQCVPSHTAVWGKRKYRGSNTVFIYIFDVLFIIDFFGVRFNCLEDCTKVLLVTWVSRCPLKFCTWINNSLISPQFQPWHSVSVKYYYYYFTVIHI